MDSKFYVRVRAYKKRNNGNQPLDLNSNVRPLYSPSELTLHRASCFICKTFLNSVLCCKIKVIILNKRSIYLSIYLSISTALYPPRVLSIPDNKHPYIVM